MADDPIKIKQALDEMKNRERAQVKAQMEKLNNPVVINVDTEIRTAGKTQDKTNEPAQIEKRVIKKSLKKERKNKKRREERDRGKDNDNENDEEDEEEDEDEDQEDENDKDEEEKKDDEDENEDKDDNEENEDDEKDEGDEKEQENEENEGEGEGEEKQPESEQDVADKFHEGQNLERGAAKGAGEGAAAGGEGAAGAAGAAAGEGAAAGAAGGAAATGGGAVAAGAGGAAAVGTAPVWGTILAIILVIIFLVIIVIIVIIKGCESNVGYYADRLTSGFGLFRNEICKPMYDTGLAKLGGPAGGGGPGTSQGKMSDASARAYLAQNGITVNHPQPQTSLEAIEVPTLDEIIRFKQECDKWASTHGGGTCPVQLTGGTESGHADGVCSHTNGYKFDMNIDDPITAFIITSTYKNANNQDVKMFESRGKRSGDNADLFVFSLTGAIYAREGNHWDVVVNCGTSIPN